MKKKLGKTVFILTMLCTLFCCSLSVSADAKVSTAIYNINTGGTQTFTLKDSSKNDVIITISEIPSLTRSLENRSYHIVYESIFAWKAEYNVVINNNTIASVNSASYQCYRGYIYDCLLKRESPKQATMSFVYKYMGLSDFTGVRTEIANNQLQVTQL